MGSGSVDQFDLVGKAVSIGIGIVGILDAVSVQVLHYVGQGDVRWCQRRRRV